MQGSSVGEVSDIRGTAEGALRLGRGAEVTVKTKGKQAPERDGLVGMAPEVVTLGCCICPFSRL